MFEKIIHRIFFPNNRLFEKSIRRIIDYYYFYSIIIDNYSMDNFFEYFFKTLLYRGPVFMRNIHLFIKIISLHQLYLLKYLKKKIENE